MRSLFALLAAFFAGLWLNEQIRRRQEMERPIIVNVQAPAPPPQPSVDRRPIQQILPVMTTDLDSFDTKSSLVQHFAYVMREGMKLELTPKQAYDLGEYLIGVEMILTNWDIEQEMKAQDL